MKNYIDIHSHILPGVDDGSESYETSMRMLQCAADDGISKIILTPHHKPSHRRVSLLTWKEKTKSLLEMAAERKIGIELYLGSELYYRSGLLEELGNGAAATLAGSHYVLVEFSPMADYEYIRNGAYSLLTGGFCPILAHVERYQNVCARKYGIEDLIEMGCYMQVNAGSVTGSFGSKTKRFVKNMLKQRQVHFVATDAHDLGKRAPALSACADLISKKYGEDYCRKLLWDHPACVLRDEEIAYCG
ncbi:MAG: hypothetical protein NC302_10515 [Bacteroidales bacterium]|nr:hypothetical protein [Bacteroidales bacterium]MCM1424540.1 hypothetical protein [bacterium]